MNPKDAMSAEKAPLSTIPLGVIAELGVAMMEGARKYGRHNYRVACVQASVYIDAAFRHMAKWWEGEDIDPDSDISHITKAIASLTVLRDAMIQGKMIDDRPPSHVSGQWERMERLAATVVGKYPKAKKPFTRRNHVL